MCDFYCNLGVVNTLFPLSSLTLFLLLSIFLTFHTTNWNRHMSCIKGSVQKAHDFGHKSGFIFEKKKSSIELIKTSDENTAGFSYSENRV